MKRHVAITTYNRPREVRGLVVQCLEMLGPNDSVYVYNDGSKNRPELPEDPRVRLVNCVHHGKERYWALINKVMADIRDSSADWFYLLPDDDILLPDYFKRSADIFESIKDRKKVCLSTHVQDHRKGKPCWNNHPQRLLKFKGVKVWDCGYMDMRIVCRKQFFHYLGFRIKPISSERWKHNPLLGSGVGQQITERLKGYGMYLLDDPLIMERDREDCPSVMNLEAEAFRP